MDSTKKKKRGPGRPFEKGNPGKQKGTQNKFTRTVKETFLAVFEHIQDNPEVNLVAFAEKYPRDFYNLASKLIPTEITGKDGKDFIPPSNISNLTTDELRELVAAAKPQPGSAEATGGLLD